MECSIRKWKTEDSTTLAAILNNKKILDNLRVPAPLSKPVNTFLNIPILFGFLQSPLPTILHPAGFLKKPVLCVKACLEAMLLKTGRLLI